MTAEGIQLGRIAAGEIHAPVVYFLSLRYEGRPAVKIGTSTRLKQRVATVSYGATLRDVLLVVPGDREVEAAYHERFRRHRIRGELFRPEGALKELLEAAPPPPAPKVAPAPEVVVAGLTIREAIGEGIFGYRNIETVRRRVHRARLEPAGQRGDGSKTYDRADLIAAARDRRKEMAA